MAKTYKSDFKIEHLDSAIGSILSPWLVQNGVETAASVEGLRKMGVDKVYGMEKVSDDQ